MTGNIKLAGFEIHKIDLQRNDDRSGVDRAEFFSQFYLR